MKKIFVFVLVGLFFLPTAQVFAAGGHDPNRVLTPSSDSVTAVAQTGANLEQLKAECNCTRKYVATGSEKIDKVRGYNRVTKKFFWDQGHNHHFAPGTVVWMASDGRRGIAEGCLNEFYFVEAVAPRPTLATRPAPPPDVELEGELEVTPAPQMVAAPQPQIIYVNQPAPTAPPEKKGGCGKGCKLLIAGIVAGGVVGAVAIAKRGSGNRDSSINIYNNNTSRSSARAVNNVGWTQGGRRGTTRRTTNPPQTGGKIFTPGVSNPRLGNLPAGPTTAMGDRVNASPVTGETMSRVQNTGNINPGVPNIARQPTNRTGLSTRSTNPVF